MTTKEAIYQLVASLDEETATAVLDYIRAIVDDQIVSDDKGDDAEQPSPLEWMKLGQPTSEDDPLWNIVGMIDDEDEAVQHERDERAAAAAAPLTYDDPLWRLVGIGSTSEPTDIATNKDEYLADAFTV